MPFVSQLCSVVIKTVALGESHFHAAEMPLLFFLVLLLSMQFEAVGGGLYFTLLSIHTLSVSGPGISVPY